MEWTVFGGLLLLFINDINNALILSSAMLWLIIMIILANISWAFSICQAGLGTLIIAFHLPNLLEAGTLPSLFH